MQFAIESEDETETNKNVAPAKTVENPPPHKEKSVSKAAKTVISSPLKSDKFVTTKSVDDAVKKRKIGKDKSKAETETIKSNVAISKTALNSPVKSDKSQSKPSVEAKASITKPRKDSKVSSDSSEVKKVCPTSYSTLENNLPLPKKTKLPTAVSDSNPTFKTPVTKNGLEMSQNRAAVTGSIKPKAMSSAYLHSQSHEDSSSSDSESDPPAKIAKPSSSVKKAGVGPYLLHLS